jgi:hypothetical protein
MRRLVVVLAVIALAGTALAQSTPPAISQSAVWTPGSDFVAKAHTVCDKVTPSPKFNECVINQMSPSGASADAVSFSRELYKASGGEVGFMASFNKVGPVDIAWVKYPLRSTNGLLLVNGKPRILNAEDLKRLDQKSLQQSFQYQNLQGQFPNLTLWPGDRDGKTWPNSQTGAKGGLQFVIGYPLRNGCETCAHAGFALFTWNFNPDGRFMGTSFMGMTPAPIPTQPDSGSTPQQ